MKNKGANAKDVFNTSWEGKRESLQPNTQQG